MVGDPIEIILEGTGLNLDLIGPSAPEREFRIFLLKKLMSGCSDTRIFEGIFSITGKRSHTVYFNPEDLSNHAILSMGAELHALDLMRFTSQTRKPGY